MRSFDQWIVRRGAADSLPLPASTTATAFPSWRAPARFRMVRPSSEAMVIPVRRERPRRGFRHAVGPAASAGVDPLRSRFYAPPRPTPSPPRACKGDLHRAMGHPSSTISWRTAPATSSPSMGDATGPGAVQPRSWRRAGRSRTQIASGLLRFVRGLCSGAALDGESSAAPRRSPLRTSRRRSPTSIANPAPRPSSATSSSPPGRLDPVLTRSGYDALQTILSAAGFIRCASHRFEARLRRRRLTSRELAASATDRCHVVIVTPGDEAGVASTRESR